MVSSMIRVPPQGPVDEVVIDRRTDRQWTVSVQPFEIAATTVTIDEWNNASERQLRPGLPGEPAVEVSWRDAVEFCNELSRRAGLAPAYAISINPEPARNHRVGWTPHDRPAADDWTVDWDRDADGYRLPTDAEWQVACRAGSTGPRYGVLDEIAWYDANSDGRVHPIAQKRPNAWGIFDTLGGIWEWCWDLYDPEVYGAYRVIRGGGFADSSWSCRAGVRRKTTPAARLDDLGLRLARTLRQTPLDRSGIERPGGVPTAVSDPASHADRLGPSGSV